MNVVTVTNAGAGAQSQRNALILWKSRSSGNFNNPRESRERCNFYSLTWQLLKKMSLGTPEPKEAIHSPNEKWESVLSEGNFNAREQKGDKNNTQSSPCAEFFKVLATVSLPLKAKEWLSWQSTRLLKGSNPHSDFRVLSTAGKAETNTNQCYHSPRRASSWLRVHRAGTGSWQLPELLLTFAGCPSSPPCSSSYPDVCWYIALE